MTKLQPIQFNQSDLDYRYFVWRMPKSDLLFLIVKVLGDLRLTNLEIEQRSLLNEIDSLRNQDYYFDTVIIDFSELIFSSLELNAILPINSNSISPNVAIICSECPHTFSNESNYNIFASLEYSITQFAFDRRKSRFDGGKTILKPQPINNFKNNLSRFERDEVSVSVELFKWFKENTPLFLIKFYGNYPLGSKGSSEGKFISLKLRELMRDFEPHGLIIDFSGMHYEWGDDIEIYPWQLKRSEKPLQFVFRQNQISSFLFKLKPDEIRISHTVEAAIFKLENMFR